ncbi:hypothetical protein RvY_01188 [Ramazzottius varieornatus]|uniref:Uncharacterized protein n=1 Tax=Ramazzottius varieornatus TaxID=947166 RepID=A0A1D1UGB8_RAMVA|nr:hypothetical protein RvY_01188 [Ramazzottius varieornatus]
MEESTELLLSTWLLEWVVARNAYSYTKAATQERFRKLQYRWRWTRLLETNSDFVAMDPAPRDLSCP